MRNTAVRQGVRALLILSLLPAVNATAARADASACSQPAAHQPFLSFGDFNYYLPVPGWSAAAFDGSTWKLSGGAKIVTARRADGSTAPVLDLPAGSKAVSPDICVTSQNPEARMMVRSVSGGGGVQVGVSYASTPSWTNPAGAGQVNGQDTAWTLSNTVNLKRPPPPPGPSGPGTAQVMRFTFVPRRGEGPYQLYGLKLAAPPPPPNTGPCSKPALSQAFLRAGDTRYYTPAPGQNGGGFVGTGWTLTRGARIVTARRADGTTAKVLQLPPGSMAVSPDICVTSLYPTARMMVRSVSGGGDVSFGVSYANANPHETGHVHGNGTSWTLSDPVNLQPSQAAGWQIVRLSLVADGPQSRFQIYDLELDPYAKG
jgi:hypothetical protein